VKLCKISAALGPVKDLAVQPEWKEADGMKNPNYKIKRYEN